MSPESPAPREPGIQMTGALHNGFANVETRERINCTRNHHAFSAITTPQLRGGSVFERRTPGREVHGSNPMTAV